MVLDKIENATLYENLHPGFKKAFEFIRKSDFSNFLPGKYAIEGEEIFVLINEYETKGIHESYPEAHQKYIDIQIMISGSEMIGYAPKSNQDIVEEYDKKKDIAFYNSTVNFFELKTNMFAIFFSNDLHQPGIALGKSKTVKKAVVKVNIEYSEKQ
jgi:YhcH/YjgK/YiaL family protein